MKFFPRLWNRADTEHSSRYPIVILAISSGLALLAQYLFYGTYLGLNAFIVTLTLLGSGIVLLRSCRKRIGLEPILLIVAIVFFSVMLAVRLNGFLAFLNVVAILYLFIYLIDEFADTRIRSSVFEYVWPVIILPFVFLRRSGVVLNRMFSVQTSSRHHERLKQILTGILMALPVLVVFTLLFTSGDLVFARYVQNIFSFTIDVDTIARVLMVLVLTVLFSGSLWYMIGNDTVNVKSFFPKTAQIRRIGTLEMGFFFGLVNALFACFILIQLSYFFSGREKLATLGLTYAEYARKGFFELMVVAVITVMLIWLSEKIITKHESAYPRSFRILSSFLTLQTLVIMTSSFQRLWLYEEMFGFTQPRYVAHAFLIWLALAFLLLMTKLLFNKSDELFLKTVFASMIVFLIGINLMNPDQFIAQRNVARYVNGSTLDVWYLNTLSDDVVPELIKFFENPRLTDEVLRGSLGMELWTRLEYRLSQPEVLDWRTAHFSRLHARNELLKRKEALKMFQEYIPPVGFEGMRRITPSIQTAPAR